ncbi:MAG TPA: hypothetical protein PLJ27_22485, partial [Polyangiaceae bacterium]|nr:hypothetical protein [Polyangiaceae bacterium]
AAAARFFSAATPSSSIPSAIGSDGGCWAGQCVAKGCGGAYACRSEQLERSRSVRCQTGSAHC